MMDFEAIKSAAEGCKAEMSRFLRDMISHPSESCEEKEVVLCIKAEMEKLGFDKVEIDGLGNVNGWMGEGTRAMRRTTLSMAGAVLTRRAAWRRRSTGRRS